MSVKRNDGELFDAIAPSPNPDYLYDEYGKELTEGFFLALSEQGKSKFRQWARDNYRAGQAPSPSWHPIVREEWARIAAEKGESTK